MREMMRNKAQKHLMSNMSRKCVHIGHQML